MKQILQDLSDGNISIEDLPCPKNKKGNVLISSKNSLVSSGTEKMLLDFGKGSYIEKARQQPDKVKMVLDKVVTDGLIPTIDAIKSKLDQPIALGYCNSGVVIESFDEYFKAGDRVVSNGFHAEVVRVPKNLCVKIPDNVDDESAAFTVLGAISLQGIRLVNPTIGECVVVSGLGLVGLLTVQMLIANGCRVLGIDYDSSRCDLARKFGADVVNLSKDEDPLSAANSFSRGRGVDAVIIAASSKSDEVMHQAAEMCRKRARIVLVGVVGLNLKRDDFFKKEISFQVSASYGPGRYDPQYEENGHDYPIGFVRWTEQRNFEAVLDMMSKGSLDVKSLISNVFTIDNAKEAYLALDQSSSLGILLSYPQSKEIDILKNNDVILSQKVNIDIKTNSPIIGFIGSGNYASRTLIPAFKKTSSELKTLISSGGISGIHQGKKFGFYSSSTDENTIWNDKDINTVVIATRHDTHSKMIISALENQKNVFVEKPLAINLEDIDLIENAYIKANKENNINLMVGFNRRFAPLVTRMKSLIDNIIEPKSFIITVNAGAIPADHWTQDLNIGGGRVIGEACHFIDLMRFLAGSKISDFQTSMIGKTESNKITTDNVSINLSFEDGSFGTIHYLANGNNAFPKERIEVFGGNKVLQLNNYKTLKGYGWSGLKTKRSLIQDKGQSACVGLFTESIKNKLPSPILINEILEVSRITIQISESLKN